MSSPTVDYPEQSEDESLVDLDADYEQQWEDFIKDCWIKGVKPTLSDYVIFREERAY